MSGYVWAVALAVSVASPVGVVAALLSRRLWVGLAATVVASASVTWLALEWLT